MEFVMFASCSSKEVIVANGRNKENEGRKQKDSESAKGREGMPKIGTLKKKQARQSCQVTIVRDQENRSRRSS